MMLTDAQWAELEPLVERVRPRAEVPPSRLRRPIGAGRAVAFRLAPGQTHEPPRALRPPDALPDVPRRAVADRGHASHCFRGRI